MYIDFVPHPILLLLCICSTFSCFCLVFVIIFVFIFLQFSSLFLLLSVITFEVLPSYLSKPNFSEQEKDLEYFTFIHFPVSLYTIIVIHLLMSLFFNPSITLHYYGFLIKMFKFTYMFTFFFFLLIIFFFPSILDFFEGTFFLWPEINFQKSLQKGLLVVTTSFIYLEMSLFSLHF